MFVIYILLFQVSMDFGYSGLIFFTYEVEDIQLCVKFAQLFFQFKVKQEIRIMKF